MIGMAKSTKPMRQVTFDSFSATSTKQNIKPTSVTQKRICITKMESVTGIDELVLKVSFKLEPSYRAFSKIKAELFFEDTTISEVLIQVLQGSLGTNELEYSWVMDTKGIVEGTYRIRVEMYEVWSSDERLCQTCCERTVKYVPQTRHARLIKIPFVKSVTNTNLAIISDQEKQIYIDIEKATKREQLSRRNE
jgi:hypothetical protein